MILVKKIVRNQVLEKNLVLMILIDKHNLFYYLYGLIFYILNYFLFIINIFYINLNK